MDFRLTPEEEALRKQFDDFYREEMKNAPPEWGTSMEAMFGLDVCWDFHKKMAKKLGCEFLYTSAKTGKGCQRIVPTILHVWSGFTRRVPTPDLNRFLQRLEAIQPPPQRYHHPVRLLYLTQTRVRPPTFALVSNTPEGIPDAYRRFLERRIRETWDLPGTPIRLHVRRRRKPGGPR